MNLSEAAYPPGHWVTAHWYFLGSNIRDSWATYRRYLTLLVSEPSSKPVYSAYLSWIIWTWLPNYVILRVRGRNTSCIIIGCCKNSCALRNYLRSAPKAVWWSSRKKRTVKNRKTGRASPRKRGHPYILATDQEVMLDASTKIATARNRSRPLPPDLAQKWKHRPKNRARQSN